MRVRCLGYGEDVGRKRAEARGAVAAEKALVVERPRDLPVERVHRDADAARVRVEQIPAEAAVEVAQEGRLVQVVELRHVLHSSLGKRVHELELFGRHHHGLTDPIIPPQCRRASLAAVDHGRLVPDAVDSRVRQPRARLS